MRAPSLPWCGLVLALVALSHLGALAMDEAEESFITDKHQHAIAEKILEHTTDSQADLPKYCNFVDGDNTAFTDGFVCHCKPTADECEGESALIDYHKWPANDTADMHLCCAGKCESSDSSSCKYVSLPQLDEKLKSLLKKKPKQEQVDEVEDESAKVKQQQLSPSGIASTLSGSGEDDTQEDDEERTHDDTVDSNVVPVPSVELVKKDGPLVLYANQGRVNPRRLNVLRESKSDKKIPTRCLKPADFEAQFPKGTNGFPCSCEQSQKNKEKGFVATSCSSEQSLILYEGWIRDPTPNEKSNALLCCDGTCAKATATCPYFSLLTLNEILKEFVPEVDQTAVYSLPTEEGSAEKRPTHDEIVVPADFALLDGKQFSSAQLAKYDADVPKFCNYVNPKPEPGALGTDNKPLPHQRSPRIVDGFSCKCSDGSKGCFGPQAEIDYANYPLKDPVTVSPDAPVLRCCEGECRSKSESACGLIAVEDAATLLASILATEAEYKKKDPQRKPEYQGGLELPADPVEGDANAELFYIPINNDLGKLESGKVNTALMARYADKVRTDCRRTADEEAAMAADKAEIHTIVDGFTCSCPPGTGTSSGADAKWCLGAQSKIVYSQWPGTPKLLKERTQSAAAEDKELWRCCKGVCEAKSRPSSCSILNFEEFDLQMHFITGHSVAKPADPEDTFLGDDGLLDVAKIQQHAAKLPSTCVNPKNAPDQNDGLQCSCQEKAGNIPELCEKDDTLLDYAGMNAKSAADVPRCCQGKCGMGLPCTAQTSLSDINALLVLKLHEAEKLKAESERLATEALEAGPPETFLYATKTYFKPALVKRWQSELPTTCADRDVDGGFLAEGFLCCRADVPGDCDGTGISTPGMEIPYEAWTSNLSGPRARCCSGVCTKDAKSCALLEIDKADAIMVELAKNPRKKKAEEPLLKTATSEDSGDNSGVENPEKRKLLDELAAEGFATFTAEEQEKLKKLAGGVREPVEIRRRPPEGGTREDIVLRLHWEKDHRCAPPSVPSVDGDCVFGEDGTRGAGVEADEVDMIVGYVELPDEAVYFDLGVYNEFRDSGTARQVLKIAAYLLRNLLTDFEDHNQITLCTHAFTILPKFLGNSNKPSKGATLLAPNRAKLTQETFQEFFHPNPAAGTPYYGQQQLHFARFANDPLADTKAGVVFKLAASPCQLDDWDQVESNRLAKASQEDDN